MAVDCARWQSSPSRQIKAMLPPWLNQNRGITEFLSRAWFHRALCTLKIHCQPMAVELRAFDTWRTLPECRDEAPQSRRARRGMSRWADRWLVGCWLYRLLHSPSQGLALR